MVDKKKNNQRIYDLELHKLIAIGGDIIVTRVPGGWLYNYCDQIIFIKYNTEFKKRWWKFWG